MLHSYLSWSHRKILTSHPDQLLNSDILQKVVKIHNAFQSIKQNSLCAADAMLENIFVRKNLKQLLISWRSSGNKFSKLSDQSSNSKHSKSLQRNATKANSLQTTFNPFVDLRTWSESPAGLGISQNRRVSQWNHKKWINDKHLHRMGLVATVHRTESIQTNLDCHSHCYCHGHWWAHWCVLERRPLAVEPLRIKQNKKQLVPKLVRFKGRGRWRQPPTPPSTNNNHST